ncbi:TonB-dependent receptor [Paraglaciecola sp.]|uniref:TonB-dependent receptor n=1 Tax=Paraglaciecola sp. TaxID=1920173 RepID=UPI00326621A7
MDQLIIRLSILLVACFVTVLSDAREVKINGFIAQGVTQADGSNFVEDDGGISFKLTEVGVNSTYRLNSTFRFAGQAVYLDGGNRYQQGARVDYLFLESQLYDSEQWSIKAQLGRNKNYHWLYSATRDVPHTRPSVILPQSLYFDAFRDVALGVDGLALVTQGNNSLGEWDINFSLGTSPISSEQKNNLLGRSAKGKLKHDNDKQFSVYWRPSLSNIQIGVALLDAEFSYKQGDNDTLVNGNENSQRFMFNILYQQPNYEIAIELMRERIIVDSILFPNFHSDIFGEGGYVQGQYFLSRDLTLLARIDIYDRDRENRSGRLINSMSQGTIPNYFGFMDQGTLGLTWSLSEKMQLQAEYHRAKGAARLAPTFTPDTVLNDNKYWTVWAVQVMYWF